MPGATVIICEFNPLHRGHLTVLERAASLGAPVVCVMSGNITQRSECAAFDKYKRAAAAIECGANLVFELPFPWSGAGSEFFAFGGVAIGVGIGGSTFVFGSENGDTEYVKCASELTERREFSEYLSRESDPASGAAKAHADALRHFGFTLGPNDKLGVEYMKAAERLRAKVDFKAVKRMTDERLYRSASSLRRSIFDAGITAAAPFIPRRALDVLGSEPDIIEDRLCELEYLYFRFFRNLTPRLSPSFEGQGGVVERLASAAEQSPSHHDFFASAATKKYTNSRLRRAALFEMFGIEREMLIARPRFTVLLGADQRGRDYLATNRKKITLSILTKPSAEYELSDKGLRQYEIAKKADELYLACLRKGTASGDFLRRRPYIK